MQLKQNNLSQAKLFEQSKAEQELETAKKLKEVAKSRAGKKETKNLKM